jgi:hypothetical protein
MRRISGFEAVAEKCFLKSGAAGVLLKMSCPVVEANVWLSAEEAIRLKQALYAKPPISVALGRSAGAQVQWIRDEPTIVFVLIGENSESWDIGLTLGSADISVILEALESVE